MLTQGQTQDAQGNALDFATASSGNTCTGELSAGATCTVNVTFTPKRPGQRYGAVELLDSSSQAKVIATAYVFGTGQGPQIAYNQANNPGAVPNVGNFSDFNEPYDLALDAAGNIFIADTGLKLIKEIPYSGGSYGTPVTLGGGFLFLLPRAWRLTAPEISSSLIPQRARCLRLRQPAGTKM